MTQTRSRQGGPVRAFAPAVLLGLCVQVGLVLALVWRFELELAAGLGRLLPLIGVGFVVHALLPRASRAWFFLALSLVGFGVVFGPRLGGALVAIGLGLIALCHLRVHAAARGALLVVAIAGLVALRAAWIPAGALRVILPVLGSIFMFRLAIYVYDLRHEKEPVPLAMRLSYFFLLPNAVFPLFPIVDYKTFLRTYYDREEAAIYAKGARWMLRGVLHLLAYRLIYQYVVVAPEAVHDLPSVLRYASGAYLLYLRVSGQFHLIIGVLCLFGFNLPETHRLYFFASGFNDLWRRINIYWKDFMMKLFFYPVFLRLNRRHPASALTVATLTVFLCSWLLHSMQWFWIRGTFPLTAVDAIFWSLFAVCVLANSALERRRGRARTTRGRLTTRAAFVRALKTAGMFTFMCALWSFWVGESVVAWFELVGRARNSPPAHFAWLVAGVGATLGVGTALQIALDRRPWQRWIGAGGAQLQALASAGVVLLLLFVSTPEVHGFETRLAGSLLHDRLNAADHARLELGYYEGLMDARNPLDRVAALRAEAPADWRMITETPGVYFTGANPPHAFEPALETWFKGATLTTNRFALRDREYPLAPADGTFRIALLGGSIEMGAGVRDDEVFEGLFEDALNARARAGHPWRAGVRNYEVLNFAMSGYGLPEQTALAEARIQQFEPDACFVFVHKLDRDKLVDMVRGALELLAADPELGPPPLPEWVAPTTAARLALADDDERAAAIAADLIAWAFERIAAACRSNGIEPVCVFLHHPPGQPDAHQVAVRDQFRRLATTAGFAFLALEGDAVYGPDRDERDWVVAPWDRHPNAAGHRRIADELLRQLERTIPTPRPSAAEPQGEIAIEAKDVIDTTRTFIVTEVLQGDDSVPLEETGLMSDGILDSISTVKLVGFLEERYGVEFAAHELSADHLDSLGAIAALVLSKRAAQ